MANFYQVKKTINGVEYTAQFNGISAALKAVDDSYIQGSNNISSLKLAEYIFNNVIVSPKVMVDNFDSIEDMNKVVEFGREVMQGNFRNEAVGGAAEKAHKA